MGGQTMAHQTFQCGRQEIRLNVILTHARHFFSEVLYLQNAHIIRCAL